MRTPRIRLEAITRADRFVVVEKASAAVQAAGGWIDDVTFFSNISVVIMFSLPPGRSGKFLEAIAISGLEVGAAATVALEAAESQLGADAVGCSLQITFVHDDPDSRRTILAVPG